MAKFARAGRKNISHTVMADGTRCGWSIRHDLGRNDFPSGPPAQSISTYKENFSNFVIRRFEAGLRLAVKTCLVSFEAFCFIFIIIIYKLCELVI